MTATRLAVHGAQAFEERVAQVADQRERCATGTIELEAD